MMLACQFSHHLRPGHIATPKSLLTVNGMSQFGSQMKDAMDLMLFEDGIQARLIANVQLNRFQIRMLVFVCM